VAHMPDYDVLIAGGGPVGAALALALRGVCSVALLEARPEDATPLDPRPIALSHGSRLILDRLDAWEALQPVTPIARIHISQRGGFGQVELDHQEAGLPALGYVVDYSQLARQLSELLPGACNYLRGASVLTIGGEPDAACVDYQIGTTVSRATAGLIAVADGGVLRGVARARTHDYQQVAVTAEVTSSRPHRNVAYERFTPEGPLALLPSGERLALVWSTAPAHAQQLCMMAENEFLRELQRAFGQRLGRFEATSSRACFPLALKVAKSLPVSRAVVLGNAAQTLHPVAGQGFNLGLRDAWELSTAINAGAREEIGAAAMLAAFEARRRLDRGGGIWFTDILVRLFSNDIGPLRLARGMGLALLGAVPPAKDFVVRRMTFGARG
jgi:2-octaprenyl-6-methoxyphenol hydroxylase